ncbi:glycosyltransferase family 2 protein [Psychrobacter sp. I-STPA10]|uniref:glycosyltransferase family 2 protein n=1 Tax=Psychrobacter sp. I-STPA10 TaxID=2585769 RepID=UPI001E4891C6|nr:glycosyltransferase family 2 protein [Psychrobacter sp. I-STPA10]
MPAQNKPTKKQLSILVPVYNVSLYLNECIDSILPQLTEQTELILMNDASTDNSAEILQQYQGLENVTILHAPKNGGLSVTRNELLKQACGEYIWFVDSDDVVNSGAIQEFLQYKNLDADIYLFDYIVYDEKLGKNYHKKGFLGAKKNIHTNQQDSFLKNIVKSNVYYAWNKIYKKSLIEQCEFKAGLKFEDIYFISDICYSINTYSYINKEVIIYRVREGSIVNSLSFSYIDDYLNAFIYQVDKYRQHINGDKQELYFYLLYKSYNRYVGLIREFDENKNKLDNNIELMQYAYQNFNTIFDRYYQESLNNIGLFRNRTLKRNKNKVINIIKKHLGVDI